jgi:hypothetical protein
VDPIASSGPFCPAFGETKWDQKFRNSSLGGTYEENHFESLMLGSFALAAAPAHANFTLNSECGNS